MRTAVIVGAGVGGLTTAALLHRDGWQVTVHERASSLPTTGTALGMWNDALKVLDRLGIGERVRAEGVTQSAGALLRPDGTEIARLHLKSAPVLITRPRLLTALAELGPDVSFDSDLTAATLDQSEADLIIGADGVWSSVRSSWPGNPQPRLLPSTIWRGWTDRPPAQASETWAPGALFGITERADSQTNWYATYHRPPSAAGEQIPEFFGGWHAGVKAVLADLDPALVLRHQAVVGPRLASYVRTDPELPDRVLIGDAAHAMTPHLGRGACEALLDAAALVDALRAHPDQSTALRRYDRRRRPRASRTQRASALMGQVATARHATRVRDGVIALIAAGIARLPHAESPA